MRRALVKDNILEFVLAGKALFTVNNNVTGNSMSFKVDKIKEHKKHRKDDPDIWFVRFLENPENRRSGSYIGYVRFNEGNIEYVHSHRKSRLAEDSRQVLSFMWLLQNAMNLPPQIEFWHEGRCGRCNRPLTDTNSIENGYGPDCWQMIGAKRQFEKLSQIAENILLGEG